MSGSEPRHYKHACILTVRYVSQPHVQTCARCAFPPLRGTSQSTTCRPVHSEALLTIGRQEKEPRFPLATCRCLPSGGDPPTGRFEQEPTKPTSVARLKPGLRIRRLFFFAARVLLLILDSQFVASVQSSSRCAPHHIFQPELRDIVTARCCGFRLPTRRRTAPIPTPLSPSLLADTLRRPRWAGVHGRFSNRRPRRGVSQSNEPYQFSSRQCWSQA